MKIVTKYPPQPEDHILKLLHQFDMEFAPRLSKRTDLIEYAKKLAQNAVWFLTYEEEHVTGHCAAYMNRSDYAYISSIAVKKNAQGMGIGSRIWEHIEYEAVKRGMQSIVLEVARTNTAGIRFYQKHACRIYNRCGEWLTMKKDLL